ncbi:MAG: hypothetical protein L6R42_007551, partial [Xanthoria sp. 1 TBL-2021]
TSAAIGTTMDLVGMNYGIGRHVYYLQHDDAVLATKLDWLCQAFVITALTTAQPLQALSKPSICNNFTPDQTSLVRHPPPVQPRKELTWHTVDDATSLMIWYTTEMYVIIIAGSLPTLRPLFQKSVYVFRSYKHRSSKGYHSYDHAPHELQPYRKKKHPDIPILQATRQDNGRSSDQDVLAANAEGITKTVDITFASSPGAEEGKKWERWEEEHFGDRGTWEDERV